MLHVMELVEFPPHPNVKVILILIDFHVLISVNMMHHEKVRLVLK